MIVLDIETSGLNWRENSMISLGSVNFENPSCWFYGECRIWEGAKIEPLALEINGFCEEELRTNKKSMKGLIEEFVGWLTRSEIKDITLGGENIWFDIDFLKDSFNRVNEKWIFGRRLVDLHSESYTNHLRRGIAIPFNNGKSDLSLDETLKYIGLPPEPKPHHAFNGAKLEAEAFSRLIYGKSLFPEFAKFKIPEYVKSHPSQMGGM